METGETLKSNCWIQALPLPLQKKRNKKLERSTCVRWNCHSVYCLQFQHIRLIFFYFFFEFIFNWRMIALQYCVGFCHTRWIIHKYTYVPSLLNLPLPPPFHPTPLGCHRAPGWAPCAHTAASHWLSTLHYSLGGKWWST